MLTPRKRTLGLLALLIAAAPLAAAPTAPVRSEQPHGTINPPQTTNPIYYPISTAATAGAETVAPEVLLRRFMERHTAMDYPAAVELAMRLVAAAPDRPEGHYNLACALSKLHRLDEAASALDQAIVCGWRDLAHLTLDPDLANLRRTESYTRAVAKLKGAIESERIVPAPVRNDPWLNIVKDLTSQTPALLNRYHVPGATMALVHDGEIVWTSSFGVRDRRQTAPLKDDDQFRLRAPMHLLAVLGCQRQEDQGKTQLAQLLLDGAQLDQGSDRGARRSDPDRDRTVATVGMRDAARRPKAPAAHSSSSVYGYLRLAIELAAQRSFSAYCCQEILEPMKMMQTGFSPAAAPVDAAESATSDPIGLVIGHSLLGSPMQPDPASDDLAPGHRLYSTAQDLARLIASAMAVDDNTFAHRALEAVKKVDGAVPGGLRLAIDFKRVEGETRVQVSDTSAGMGCLMRWYPASRDGIVILYNSATGADAADRIAHIALGGE